MYLKRLRVAAFAGLSFVSGMTVTGSVFAQAASTSTQLVRITQAVDETNRVTLKSNTLSLTKAFPDRGAVPQSMATGRILLVLRRSAAQEESLKSYLASLQNAASPNYRHWLTPAQFGATYGIGDADLQTVELWLQSHGFKVEKVQQARNAIEFSGTIGQLETTFQTSIHSFAVHGETHLANTSDPSIPAALATVVRGVAPLNDLHPKAMNQPGTNGVYDASTKSIKPSFTLFSGTTPLLYADPADAATIYDTPNATLNPNYSGTTYDGTGVKIGVVGDSNIEPAYPVNYRVAFLGETAATANVPTVVVDGNDPGVNGDSLEGLLDVEIAGGLAPGAKIYFYTSSDTDLQSGLFDAIFRAIDDNTVSILNISFGACEANLGSDANAAISEIFEQAAAQGISVVVSSGDSGSATCDASNEPAAQYGLTVNGIASTPFNIAVGGTDFDVLLNSFSTYVTSSENGSPSSGSAPYYRTALSYIPEEPWNDSTYPNTNLASNVPELLQGSTNVVAGGGGASAVYAKPAFQTALTPNDSARDLPDVSFLAANGLYGASWVVCAQNGEEDPDCQTSNGQFIDGAHFSGFGGTSTSAPAFSGMLALVEQKVGSRLGQANYVLYQLASSKYASVFHDITTGDNSVYCAGGSPDCGNNSFLTGYDATTGYDQASGLGSVDVANMVASWGSVALTGTTTTLSIDGSTSPVHVVHGTSLAFKVGVTPATATGAAAIIDTANEVSGGPQNNSQIPITLTGGTGSTNYNGLPGGTYMVDARYSGDTSDAASTAPAINVTIDPEPSTTALGVNAYDLSTGMPVASLSAVPYGAQTFLDANIYGTAEGYSGTVGIATGTESFFDGSTSLGQAPVSSSNSVSYPALPVANETNLALSVGSHSLTAKYSGDPSYDANTSAPVSVIVVQNISTVSATATATTIPSVASTTLTVSVLSPSYGVAPTGSVVLTANGSTLTTLTGGTGYAGGGGYAAIVQFKYTLAGSALVAGNNTITLTYSGDTNYKGSTGSIVISVTPSKFTLKNSGVISLVAGATSGNTATITASPTNSFVGVVNLTCAVTNPAGAVSPATCSVPSSLDIAGSASVNGTLSVGTTANTTPGTYTVTVTGTDAATGKITASTNVAVTVTAPPPTPAIALSNSGNITIAPGASSGNTSAITVTPSGGFSGAVSLSCAVTAGVANANDAPTCSIPSSISITSTSAVTATLTITTTAATSAMLHVPSGTSFGYAGGGILAFAIFLGVPRRRRRWSHLAGLLSLVLVGAVVGCGSGTTGATKTGNPGTSAGTYVVTVTAASTGVTSQTTAVNVSVN